MGVIRTGLMAAWLLVLSCSKGRKVQTKKVALLVQPSHLEQSETTAPAVWIAEASRWGSLPQGSRTGLRELWGHSGGSKGVAFWAAAGVILWGLSVIFFYKFHYS